MSDYIPNPPDPSRDPRNNRNYDAYYEPSGGKGLTLVVGILVAIALVAGLMFFAGPRDRTDQAQLPAQERTMTPPADQTRLPPIPPRPATPPAANPAPANPQQ
jgi:type IV secretory pathway VirB10-like protein